MYLSIFLYIKLNLALVEMIFIFTIFSFFILFYFFKESKWKETELMYFKKKILEFL